MARLDCRAMYAKEETIMKKFMLIFTIVLPLAMSAGGYKIKTQSFSREKNYPVDADQSRRRHSEPVITNSTPGEFPYQLHRGLLLINQSSSDHIVRIVAQLVAQPNWLSNLSLRSGEYARVPLNAEYMRLSGKKDRMTINPKMCGVIIINNEGTLEFNPCD